MRKTKKLLAVMLSVLMLFSCTYSAFAAQESDILPAPADNIIDTSVYMKTVLKDPMIAPANAKRLYTAVGTLTHLDDRLTTFLKQDVLTGQRVVDAIDALIGMVVKRLESDPQLAPFAGTIKFLFMNESFIRALKQDEKFAPAAKKFDQATQQGLPTIVDVKEGGITFTSADFGFTDGDAYGFVDALVCMMSEFCLSMNVRSVLGDFTDSVRDDTYVAGNYDLFVPLYELLESDPISSVEFTRRVAEAENSASEAEYARFRAAANLTLKGVADLLARVENDGASAVIDVLPKLLYALDSGMVNELVQNLLRDKSLFGMVQFNDMLKNLDLNSGLLWDIVDQKLITGTDDKPAGFDFDKDGQKETKLPMTKAQFDALVQKLEFAADPVVRSSVSAVNKNRLALETDSALVCAILCNAAAELLASAEGSAFALKAVSGIERRIVRRLAEGFISTFRTEFGRFVLRVSQRLLVGAAELAAVITRILPKRNGIR